MESKNLVVVGAGRVGTALTGGLLSAGHRVTVAVRDPATAAPRVPPGADVVAVERAPRDVDAVVLAVPVDALASVVATLTLPAGTVVVDATNAVGSPVPGGHHTVADHLRALAPQLVHVKAFNTVGAEHLADGRLRGTEGVFLPVAGDDAGRDLVVGVAASLGFDVHDLGGPEAVRLVEAHAALWIHLALVRGEGRGIVFALHRR